MRGGGEEGSVHSGQRTLTSKIRGLVRFIAAK